MEKGWRFMQQHNTALLCIVAMLVYFCIEIAGVVDVRWVHEDEPWYGNPAFNLVHGNGLVNTITGSGGNANYIMPLLISLSMRVFGDTLFAIRFTSVLCGVFFLLFLSLTMRQFKSDWKTQCWVYALFIAVGAFNIVFRFGRPECAAITFCLAGILCFYVYRQQGRWFQMLLLSVCAYLGACAHPYALLLFACIGAELLYDAWVQHSWKQAGMLIMLVAAAAAVLLSITLINAQVQGIAVSQGAEVLRTRTAIVPNFGERLWDYVQEVFFSKHCLYTLPFLLLLIIVACKKECGFAQHLSWIGIAYVVIYPFVFSADKAMIANAVDYLCTVGIVVFASVLPCVKKTLTHGQNKWFNWLLAIYIVANFAIITVFNWCFRYDKANSVLQEEVDAIIPDGAKVYGTQDMWCFKMNSDFRSIVSRLPDREPDYFDYMLTDGRLETKYDRYFLVTFHQMLDYAEENWELVYCRETMQYGKVRIFKRPQEKNND